MSYILDALKKSDQQRQRGATPMLQLAQATEAPPRRPALSQNGAIALALIGVGIIIGWWQPWRAAPSSTPGPVAQPVAAPAPMPAPRQISLPPAAPAQTEPTDPAPSRPEPVAPAPIALAEAPPAIAQELPAIKISLHSYSANPKERAAMINGALMKEGDTIAPGLRLEQITAKGVVLGYKGYRIPRGLR